MAGLGAGFVMAGAAENRNRRRQLDLEERRINLTDAQANLDREQAKAKLVFSHLNDTRSQIDDLIKTAAEAKENGATPEQVAGLRRMVETLGGSLGVGGEGIPKVEGLPPVPGAKGLIDTSLRRFDATLAATQAKGPGGPFEGQGIDAQVFNTLTVLGDKLRSGVPLTSQEKAAYSLAYVRATEPKLTGSPQTGYTMVQPTIDGNLFPAPDAIGAPAVPAAPAGPAPAGPEVLPSATPAPETVQTPSRPGATVTQLSGPTRTNANEAGRAALISSGVKSARQVRDAIVDPAGYVDRALIFTMASDIPLLGKGVPFTEGRTVRGQMEDALSAKLRLETGAQANAEEIQNMLDRFMPSTFDDDATVKDKLGRMVEFFETAIAKSDPEAFEVLTSRAADAGDIPDAPEGETGARFSGFDPSSGAAIFERADGTFFGVPRGR